MATGHDPRPAGQDRFACRLGPHSGDADCLGDGGGLRIYLPCVSGSGLVPAETAAALLALRGAGVPAHWLQPVLVTGAQWRGAPVAVRLPRPAVAEAQLPAEVADCRLPAAHLPAERLCVAGLCAVVRRAVKTVDGLRWPDGGHYCRRDDSLLGFRRGTLAPPADASLWTRFCERDVPEALRAALAATRGPSAAVGAGTAGSVNGSESAHVPNGCDHSAEELAADGKAPSAGSDGAVVTPPPASADAGGCSDPVKFTVPAELLQFEHHMHQPLRVHNVWKQDQASGGTVRAWGSGDHRTALQCVRHTYAEGHVLTISDLLLYPCLRLLTEALRPHGLRLSEAAPAVSQWMAAVEAVPGLAETWEACFPPEQPSQPGPRLALSLPEVAPQSLYKKDPARYKPKSRLFTVQSEVAAALERLEAARFVSRVAAHPGSGQLRLDWSALPAAASPAEGGLPASRLARKQHQLENLTWLAVRAARPGDTIVDFCCGGGHLGLLLAVLRPDCHVVLVENKEESLRRGQDRAAALNLTNVSLYQCNMEFYRGQFQLGVALHACGVATDLVAERCLAAGAALVCCPCCYGAVHDFGSVRYPRSAAGRRTGAAPRDWLVLGHAADQTHADGSEKSRQGRRCMALVDSDRAAHLREAGYRVLLTVAEPADCSEKNHLLLAVPPRWDGDHALLAAGAAAAERAEAAAAD
ncbi:glutathione S-transferase C-terminal domain-containing protein homolog [Amphibalanus amphitrite]|uniref:glutathione S-transferase C-terminal domain-containing protein homolog n=1 Tax=Amphibalanus amphitrite TaxID=1232801 RepID=UPI001C903093|nr:glutathione S-transferase C-terminal domain-containing protein homolog [Amphibalanus amphitrite]